MYFCRSDTEPRPRRSSAPARNQRRSNIYFRRTKCGCLGRKREQTHQQKVVLNATLLQINSVATYIAPGCNIILSNGVWRLRFLSPAGRDGKYLCGTIAPRMHDLNIFIHVDARTYTLISIFINMMLDGKHPGIDLMCARSFAYLEVEGWATECAGSASQHSVQVTMCLTCT